MAFKKSLLAFSFIALVLPTCAEAQITTKAAVIVSKVGGKCLRVVDGSASEGAAVTQWTCDDSLGSRWMLLPQAGSSAPYVQVIAEHSGKCLSVAGGSLVDATPVIQSACTGLASQLWIVQPFGQFYRLMAKHSGKCLNVDGEVPDNGAQLIQWPCIGAINEIWAFSEGFLGPTQRTRLVNISTNLCADDVGSLVENAAVILGNCRRTSTTTSTTSQQWALKRVLDGYRFNVLFSNKCLAPLGASIANDAPIVQVTCALAMYQVWAFNSDGTLVNKSSNKCLDFDGSAPGSNLIQDTCNGAVTQKWHLNSAADVGSWSNRITLPLVPVAAAALKNNKIMFWSAYDDFTFAQNLHGWTQTALFDVATGSVSSLQVSNTGHDMFCPGTAMLADGRVLVNGGDTAPATSVYDPDTRLWTIGGNMHIPRGYNADVVLDNTKIFTLGGSWNGNQGGKGGELWSAPNLGWAILAGASSTPIIGPDPEGVFRGDNHPWLFSTGNGMVFHAGPSAQMNWFNTNGSGSSVSAGMRGTDLYSINGNAVMYGNKKILKLGGAPAYEGAAAVVSAYTINIRTTKPVVIQVGSLTYARTFQNSVILPNGTVFVAGGQLFGAPFSDAQSILAGELWSNVTGNFTTMASAATPRNYHSVAVLLQDGRVLSGGGGLCGNCDNNHPDFEYYSPGYLFQANGLPAVRPVILSAPSKVGYNQPIMVKTDISVASFVLIRMSAATHSVNNDQRRIPLTLAAQSGTAYTVISPSDSGVGVPGYYMLFALKTNGVPSIAAIILIGNV